jgi:hypothetical protein
LRARDTIGVVVAAGSSTYKKPEVNFGIWANGRCTVTYLPQVVDAHDDHYQHLQRCVIAARAGLQKLSSRLVGGRAFGVERGDGWRRQRGE